MTVFSRGQDSQNFLQPRWSSPASFLSTKAFYTCCVMLAISSHAQAATSGCPDTFDAGVDYFPDKVVADEAEHFTVSYHKNYKVLENTLAQEAYVLTLCGTPVPDVTQFANETKFFEIPLTAIAVDDTTTATFLELLGLRSKITRMSTDYVTSPCINEMASNGQLDTFESAFGNSTIREEHVQEVDAVFTSGNRASDSSKTIIISAVYDPSPLNRAEWIEFVSVLFNMESVAKLFYEDIKTKSECHSEFVSNMPSPVVAWIDYSDYNYCPDGTQCKFEVENAGFKADFITDAGGIPFLPDVNFFKTSEELLSALVEGGVDIVLDGTYFFSEANYELLETTFNFPNATDAAAPKFIKNQQVWRYDKAGKAAGGPWGGYADDWLESSLPEPNVVQQDLLYILHPNCAYDSTRWFRNVAQGETRVLINPGCADTSAILLARGAECPVGTCTAEPTTEPSATAEPTAENEASGSDSLGPQSLCLCLLGMLCKFLM